MYKNLQEILDTRFSNIIRKAKINLGATQVIDGRRRVIDDSGDLRNSLKYSLSVSNSGRSYSADISMLDYGVYQDRGVKGVTSVYPSARLSPFRYDVGSKIPFPYIRKWIDPPKPIRARDLKTGKFLKQNDSVKNSLAFVIAKSIKEKGISATRFLSDPLEDEFQKFLNDVNGAFGDDIDNFLTN